MKHLHPNYRRYLLEYKTNLNEHYAAAGLKSLVEDMEEYFNENITDLDYSDFKARLHGYVSGHADEIVQKYDLQNEAMTISEALWQLNLMAKAAREGKQYFAFDFQGLSEEQADAYAYDIIQVQALDLTRELQAQNSNLFFKLDTIETKHGLMPRVWPLSPDKLVTAVINNEYQNELEKYRNSDENSMVI